MKRKHDQPSMDVSSISLRKQNTIGNEAQVSGFGYWHAKDVTVTFRPAEPGAGITFIRSDLKDRPRIPARVEYRVEVPRRTVLSCHGQRVEMIEHVMAALAGLQIDNCEVWIDGPEVPGCDGSSLPFVQALLAAGRVEQSEEQPCVMVTETIRVADDDSWVEARPLTRDQHPEMQLQFRIDYGINHIIGRQTFRFTMDSDKFVREVAPARTYLLKEEADWMRNQGLGKRTTYQDVLVFADPEGLLDNELRFEDECVRHKMLDMIGDLALAGCDLVGQFVGSRSGHRLNALLAKALLAEGRKIHPAKV